MVVAIVTSVLIGSLVVGFVQSRSNSVAPYPGAGPAGSATRPASARPPTASVPQPSPTKSPSASPTKKPFTPNRSLTKNTIYTIDLGKKRVSCDIDVRTPKPPLRNSSLASYLRTLIKCMDKAFSKPLAAKGMSLSTPKVKVYKKSIKSPCGRFTQNGAPAYYCSANQTIYWPATRDDGNEAYTFARLGYVGLAAHEFGHHLQATTGLSAGYAQKYYAADGSKDRYRLSRRLELQAQCFEGVFLAMAAQTIDLSDNDRYQMRIWHGFTGDEDPPSSRKPDHGSSSAQIRWLNRGLEDRDFGRCNTWKASKASVK